MTRSRLLAAFSLFTAAIAGCSSTSPNAASQSSNESFGEADQHLYGLGSTGSPWPGGVVPVCYADIGDHVELQGLIPSILFNSWTRAANITFTGFGACSGSGNEVTISFLAGTNGSTDNLGQGNRSVLLVSDDTAPGLPHFTYEVIHELGHALGFAHEMKRPDNWPGGVETQCLPSGRNAPSQYQVQPGGVNLTPNYDPNSIMNYCDPLGNNTTQLSVGDILGASSPSGYGPSGCTFTDTATQCDWRAQLHAESTFSVPAQCPTTAGWVLQSLGPDGAWVNVPRSCSDGSQVGTCAAAQQSSVEFTLGWQAEGAVGSGPPIGSSQTVRMCDAFSNCTAPFHLSTTDCSTQADQLYLNPGNSPLQVAQDSAGLANVLMYGPWIQVDQGMNAVGVVVSNPIPGATVSLSQGTTLNGAGILELYVAAPLSTPVGTYTVTVQATDLASGVTRTADAPVQVLACTPTTAENVCGGIFASGCGVKSIGCGQTVDCGGCSAGSACSSGFCCPDGTSYDFAQNYCKSNTPVTCPTGTSLCADTGECLTQQQCNRLIGGGCKGTRCY